jgi:hypothetical protein
MNRALIVFTRYPVAGQAKTRLIPALGAEGAANLHRRMTEAAIAQAKPLKVDILIDFTGATLDQMQSWLGADLHYRSQCPGDLGDRLIHACQTAFDQGYESVVMIGTDCPGLDAETLAIAFERLIASEMVIGPTTDGGYYLIGLRRPIEELFTGIAWSTEIVFQQTLSIAQALQLSIAKLPLLSDVDRPEDLAGLCL